MDLLDCPLRRCVCGAALKARAGVALEVEVLSVDLSLALPHDFEALLLKDPSERAGSTLRDVHPYSGHVDAAVIVPRLWWVSLWPPPVSPRPPARTITALQGNAPTTLSSPNEPDRAEQAQRGDNTWPGARARHRSMSRMPPGLATMGVHSLRLGTAQTVLVHPSVTLGTGRPSRDGPPWLNVPRTSRRGSSSLWTRSTQGHRRVPHRAGMGQAARAATLPRSGWCGRVRSSARCYPPSMRVSHPTEFAVRT